MEVKIKDLAHVIENHVDEKDCNFFIETYNKFQELAGIEGSYKYDSKTRQDDDFLCLNLDKVCKKDPELQIARDLAWKYIKEAVEKYVKFVNKEICATFDDFNICNTHNIRIMKYAQGQSIKDHTDVDKQTRASCTLNLNNQYTGGRFNFFGGRHNLSLNTGDALVFPAEPIWIHGTEPVDTGTRYSINCFLHR